MGAFGRKAGYGERVDVERSDPGSKPFWETKSLAEMNPSEWESLCDGCRLCCLVRFEDEDSGEVIPTRVHCQLFDPDKCSCSNYVYRR